ncbi:MAG: restriction endonuclease subunit S [Crocosphaera sp.]
MSETAKSIEIKDIITIHKGKPPEVIPYYGKDSIPYLSPEFLRGKQLADLAKPSSNGILVNDGDIILLWDGSNAGEVFAAKRGLLASKMALIEHSNDFLKQYFFYVLKRWEQYLKGQTSGSGIPHVDRDVLGSLNILLLNKKEQTQIATILSKIDRAIEQTEKLIAKQQRIKTGLMQDLLTKGIDENGNIRSEETHQFKDSVLGRIPVDWEVKNLDYVLTDINAGKSPDCPDIPAIGDEWGVLKVSAVHPLGFKAQENKVIINPDYINPNYEVKDGDLLITRANTPELVGLTCLVENPPPRLLISDKTLRLIINKNVAVTQFIFFITQMSFVRSQIEINATGSSAGMKNISQQIIRNIKITLPRIQEQEKIINLLNMNMKQINTNFLHLIKLKCQKTGLMQDLLTGKVRVTELLKEKEINNP